MIMNYAEALAELEKILAELNAPNVDIDTLAAKVKRATELIALCRTRLKKVESDVQRELNSEKLTLP